MHGSLARKVRERAGHVCEYCRMPHAYYPTVPFPIDHIIARQHGGKMTLGNLALSCLHDNSHKGPNIAGVDPRTGKLTKLFNPRRHKWERHFRWDGPYLNRPGAPLADRSRTLSAVTRPRPGCSSIADGGGRDPVRNYLTIPPRI